MDATVVVPLEDGSPEAGACLAALAPLAGTAHVRLVVVTGAHERLDALGLPDGGVEVVRRNGRSGLAVSAALGTAHAAGDVIVLLRGHGRVQDGWLAPLVSALRDPGIAAVASVRADAPAGTPAVGAPALAWRRADLSTVPEVPDGLVVAALCAQLARRGEIEVAAASVVVVPRPG